LGSGPTLLPPRAWFGIGRPAVVMRYMTVPAASHVAGKDTVYLRSWAWPGSSCTCAAGYGQARQDRR